MNKCQANFSLMIIAAEQFSGARFRELIEINVHNGKACMGITVREREVFFRMPIFAQFWTIIGI